MCSSRSSALPATLAHSLLADVVDGDARLAWLGTRVGLADGAQPDTLIEEAELVVFDLETTGLSAASDRMCEIGAVRVKALEIDETFETLVDPGVALPPTIVRLTGLHDAELRRAPRPELAVRRFLAFAGDAPLVAHNARFDVGFLDHAVQRLTGRRVAAPVVDTVWLARRLLQRRSERFSLAQLAHFFGTSADPVPPRAAGRARDGRDPRRAPRARAGARRTDARRGHRARGAAGAQAPRQALARRRCTDDTGRLPLPRPKRHGPLRREGARPARAASLLLRRRSPAPGRRGRARRARAGRLARAGIGARGVARGASPHP